MKNLDKERYFAGKVAVVTGAGSGIGRALAIGLAGRGADVALADVDTISLKETGRSCEALGAKVRADYLDISDPDSVPAYAGEVSGQFGRVDQLYNIAGIAYFGDVEHERVEDMRRVLDVNLWGTVAVTKAFLPHLLETGNGHVVIMSSLFGLVTFPGQSAYCVSKFAVRAFAETLRQEMLAARRGVRVTCVHPGGIKTSIARSMTVADGLDGGAIARIFDRRLALHTPEAAAGVILDGVLDGRARVLIGAEAKAFDLLARLAPAGAQRAALAFSRAIGLVPSPRSADT